MSEATRFRTVEDGSFAEGKTAVIGFQLTDGAGADLAEAALTTLTLTLFDRIGGAIINSRSQQSVLDANGGTVSSTGVVAMTLGPLDMAITSQVPATVTRVAFFEWTYNGGTQRGGLEVELVVENLDKVS